MSKEINDLKQQIMWLQNQNASLINRQEALRDHFAGLAMQELMAADVRVVWDALPENPMGCAAFIRGVKFAEKAHGIGDGE